MRESEKKEEQAGEEMTKRMRKRKVTKPGNFFRNVQVTE